MAVGAHTQGFGAELPTLIPGSARVMGSHVLLYRSLLGCHHPAPALPGLKPQPCSVLSWPSCPRGRRGSVVPAAASWERGDSLPSSGWLLSCLLQSSAAWEEKRSRNPE